jgi:hypothetical protein
MRDKHPKVAVQANLELRVKGMWLSPRSLRTVDVNLMGYLFLDKLTAPAVRNQNHKKNKERKLP